MELGFAHPDMMLRSMSSKQIAEWYAYATLEPVGNAQNIQTDEGKAKARRARVEGGLKSLMEKQGG